MLTKILGLGLAVLVVVCVVLGFQLSGAHSANATLTSERDAAKTDAANARSAQQTAEKQNAALLQGFQALDRRLTGLDDTQKANAEKLASQLTGLNTIQKTEGDTDASFECLDQRLPGDLDQRMRQ